MCLCDKYLRAECTRLHVPHEVCCYDDFFTKTLDKISVNNYDLINLKIWKSDYPLLGVYVYFEYKYVYIQSFYL